MTQAHKQKLTFEEYLTYEDDTDNRYELIDGELVTLPPNPNPTLLIVSYLFLVLVILASLGGVSNFTCAKSKFLSCGRATQLTATQIWWFCAPNTSC
jgi:Uma2 family endonuclease